MTTVAPTPDQLALGRAKRLLYALRNLSGERSLAMEREIRTMVEAGLVTLHDLTTTSAELDSLALACANEEAMRIRVGLVASQSNPSIIRLLELVVSEGASLSRLSLTRDQIFDQIDRLLDERCPGWR
jgi:hypothetical protein